MLRFAPALDIDLHEGRSLLRHFPWRGALASGDADDHRADLAAFAGLQLDLFGDIVALVEEAEHRDALVHRGRAVIIDRRGRAGRSYGAGITQRHHHRFVLGCAHVAGGKHQHARQREGQAELPHRAPQLSALPGVHAS
ncbi:hypothetical protein GCM10009076_04450 [Erythrobacter ramosus]